MEIQMAEVGVDVKEGAAVPAAAQTEKPQASLMHSLERSAATPPPAKRSRWAAEWEAFTSSEDWLAVHAGVLLAAAAWVVAAADSSGQGGRGGPLTAIRAGSIAVFALMALPLLAAARLRAHAAKYKDIPHLFAALGYMAQLFVFLLAALAALVIGALGVMRDAGMGYAVWALLLGIVAGNTLERLAAGGRAWAIQAKEWIDPAAGGGEFFIKVGLVLLAVDIEQ
ncbi:hypothetical protein T484DRAFT_1803355, partial [Baffinella frigidus]